MEIAPILVAEDDPSHVVLIKKTFVRAGIGNPLIIASDGEEALAHLSKNSSASSSHEESSTPVLVLLDVHLPKRPGLEVLEWIKNDPDLSSLPVVVLTSSDQSEDINRAYALGAASYLIKPVGFDAMLEVVRTLKLHWVLMRPGEILE